MLLLSVSSFVFFFRKEQGPPFADPSPGRPDPVGSAAPAPYSRIPPVPAPFADRNADSLPSGAFARLGSSRLRHGASVTALAYSDKGDILLSGSEDRTISAWDAATGRELWRRVTVDPVSGLWLLPGGRRFVACSSGDADYLVCDVATGAAIHRFFSARLKSASVREKKPFNVSADGSRIATVGRANSVAVWNLADGSLVREIPGVEALPLALVFGTPDRVIVIYKDGTLRSWDVRSGKAEEPGWLVKGGDGLAEVAACTGGALIAAAYGGNVGFWDLDKRAERAIGSRRARSLAFSTNGKFLAGASADGRLWMRYLVPPVSEVELPVPGLGTATALVPSPDGRQVAVGTYFGVIRIIDVATRTDVPTLEGHTAPVTSVAFMPGDRGVLTAGEDGRIILWDSIVERARHTWSRDILPLDARDWNSEMVRVVTPGAIVTLIPGVATKNDSTPLTRPVFDKVFAVSPDGRLLAHATAPAPGSALDAATTVIVRDLDRGKIVSEIPVSSVPESLGFNRTGDRLAAALKNRTVFTWKTETGEVVGAASIPTSLPYRNHVHFAPAGFLVVMGGAYDARAMTVGDTKAVLASHLGALQGQNPFSPVGSRLAAVAWGSASNLLLLDRPMHTHGDSMLRLSRGRATALRFSPDGRTFAAGLSDGTTLLCYADWKGRGRAPEPSRAESLVEKPASVGTILDLKFDRDLSGTGIVPTSIGRVSWSDAFVEGARGQALRVASVERGQSLQFPECRDLPVPLGWTVQFWCRAVSWPADTRRIRFPLLNCDLFAVDLSETSLPTFYYKTCFPNGEIQGQGSFELPPEVEAGVPGTWRHIAATCDAKRTRLTFFVNGSCAGEVPVASALPTLVGPLTIGLHGWDGTLRVVALDELRIDDRELTAEEIAKSARR